jgi:hypothetical protein
MNWTCRLLAVALAAAASLSLDVYAQSTAAAELNLGVEALSNRSTRKQSSIWRRRYR